MMQEFTHHFQAMGTDVGLWLWQADEQTARQALAETEHFFRQTEARLSRFQPESELSQLNRSAGQPFIASDILFQLVEAALYWRDYSGGVLAYLLLTGGVMWGLVQSGGILRPTIPPLLALGLHSFLNWGALAMSALHGLILLGDNYIKMSLPDIIIPFIGPYKPFLVGLGVIGFYLMFLFSSSFYARKWLGQKTFRVLHYGSYPTFLLVTWHSLGAGTDSGLMWLVSILSLGAVSLLTLWRIANTAPKATAIR